VLDGAAAFVTGTLLPVMTGIVVAVTASAACFRWIARKAVHAA